MDKPHSALDPKQAVLNIIAGYRSQLPVCEQWKVKVRNVGISSIALKKWVSSDSL